MAPPSVSLPTFTGDPDDFEAFVLAFERYARVFKISSSDRLDYFLLACGFALSKVYSEIPWPSLTAEEVSAGTTQYSRAVAFLRGKVVPNHNDLAERVKLHSLRQGTSTVQEYVTAIRRQIKRCDFEDYPERILDERMRDVFVFGLNDPVKQVVYRIYGSKRRNGQQMTFADAIGVAETEESTALLSKQPQVVSAAKSDPAKRNPKKSGSTGASSASGRRCFWCGRHEIHGKSKCPAADADCRNCGKKGHFQSVCKRGSTPVSGSAVAAEPRVNMVSSASVIRRHAITVTVNGVDQMFTVDSGSDLTLVTEAVANRLRLSIVPLASDFVSRAVNNQPFPLVGVAEADLLIDGHQFSTDIYVASSLSDDALLGLPVLSRFTTVTFHADGDCGALHISTVRSPNPVSEFSDLFESDLSVPLAIEPVSAISLRSDKPVRSPSRRFSATDRDFIRKEVENLRSQNIITPVCSPYRSQPVVVKSDSGVPKRLAIDYASTINPLTVVDAFPLPLIAEILDQVAPHKVFSILDCRSAYFQVPLVEKERIFTAFEACGELFAFNRIPFGITNGVSAFQRVISNVLSGLSGCFAYVDDIIVCGSTEQEHDERLRSLFLQARKFGLRFSLAKCQFRCRSVSFLGHVIGEGKIAPDPSRLQPILEFPVPHDLHSLSRFLGLAVYFSRYIARFADVAAPLFDARKSKSFPLNSDCVQAVDSLKKSVAAAALAIPTGQGELLLECDASGVAVGATLTEEGRPIAFVSRRLSDEQRRWSAPELEAYAVYHAITSLRHFLIGRSFRVLTDQRGVSFLLEQTPRSAVKNAKLCRWRLELAEFRYTIQYRPGRDNAAADALSRVSACHTKADFVSLVRRAHVDLGHPGQSRLQRWVKERYFIPGLSRIVRDCVRGCRICAEEKARPFRPDPTPLVAASQPWQRLSIDFMGPKPSNSAFRYLFTVIDECSRYPFAFCLESATASAAMDCLKPLISLFGVPLCIHSDRGAQFESNEFTEFCRSFGITKSRTTAYNPTCNGQVERLNGTLWRTMTLILRQKTLPELSWSTVVVDALSAIRALPCRSLDWQSPHDVMFRFRRAVPGFTPPREPTPEAATRLPPWLFDGAECLLLQPSRPRRVVTVVRLLRRCAVVRLPSGIEDSVAFKHLARLPPADSPSDADGCVSDEHERDSIDSSEDDASTVAGGLDELAPNVTRTGRRVAKPPRYR